MKSRFLRPIVVAVPLVVFVALTGCAKKPKPEVTPPPQTETRVPETPTTPSETPSVEPTTQARQLRDVFFDYDKYNLRMDAQETLNDNGRKLIEDAGTRVLLEGHCDERGTVEYNLALGDRRANAVKQYLIRYGVDGSRLRTISYGEERPFASGSNEEAWSQNRRVHFVEE